MATRSAQKNDQPQMHHYTPQGLLVGVLSAFVFVLIAIGGGLLLKKYGL